MGMFLAFLYAPGGVFSSSLYLLPGKSQHSRLIFLPSDVKK